MESVRHIRAKEEDFLVRGFQKVERIVHHVQETWENDALPLPDKGVYVGPSQVPNQPMLESAIGSSSGDQRESVDRELA
eukprot:9892542-Alexandrium_andersonii.AAC.1